MGIIQLATFLFLIFAPTTHAVTTVLPTKCTQRYEFALNSFPPLFSVDKNGVPKGIDIDIAKALMNKMGCPFSTQGINRPLAQGTLVRGKTDMVLIVAEGTYSESEGTYVPLFSVNREMIVRKAKKGKNKTFQDYIKSKNITFSNLIGSRGSLRDEEHKLLQAQGRILNVPDGISAYNTIKRGRADAVVAPTFLNNYYYETLNLEPLFDRVVEHESTLSIGLYLSKITLSKESKEMVLNAVEELRSDGTFLRLLVPYLHQDQKNSVHKE